VYSKRGWEAKPVKGVEGYHGEDIEPRRSTDAADGPLQFSRLPDAGHHYSKFILRMRIRTCLRKKYIPVLRVEYVQNDL
jgi:hypothetical protein